MVSASTAAAAANVDPQVIDDYRRDGVACLRGALDRRWLEACERAWTWSITHPGPAASPLQAGATNAFQDLCNPDALPHYRDLLQHAPLGDIAAAVWGTPEVWFMYEQVFHKVGGSAGRTPWHQDSPYLAIGGDDLLVMWITFEAMPREISLEYIVNSHRGPLYDGSRFDPVDPTLPLYGQGLPRLPDIERERDRHAIVSYATEPGDIVLFHPAILHGGGRVSAEHPVRRTLSLRFFGRDAHYEARPGPAGPFYGDIHGTMQPGDPFRHPRFLKIR